MSTMENEEHLNAVFGALADGTRRAILSHLFSGPKCVSELAAPFEMSLPAISKHLKVLEKAGLLTRDRRGRVHNIAFDGSPLEDVDAWLTFARDFWHLRFQYLDQHLEHIGENDHDGGND